MDELKQNERQTPCEECGGCPCAQEAALDEAVDNALAQELLPDLPDAPREDIPARVRVVDIRFRSGGKVYFFDPGELELRPGDHVIMDTARGAEYGICASGCHTVADTDVVAPLRKILRIATEQDERVVAANRDKEKRAYDVCLQKIQEHKLEMQLVSVECAFDGSKILFFFTADGRVDFRELVKNLASIFRTRIELRQIGVRDKAKMVGGLGVCGRPFCCSQFLEDFQPVSIKMAKTQNLSLNPTKISGTCGRLMCCLKYEQEAYEDLHKSAPKAESFVDTPEGRGTVCDVNLLRQTVRVRMEDHPETIGTFRNSEIAILRSGKAKKTDPPIPRDLAPISGQPRKPQRTEPASPEDPMPLMFKRLDDYAASAGYTEPKPESAEEPAEHPRRRNRRRRRPAGEARLAQPAQQPRQESKPKPQAAEPSQKPKSNRRRRNRRPKNPGNHAGNAPE